MGADSSRADSWADFRAHCDAVLDGLPLEPAQPLTIDALCAAIERQRGRRLTLSPLPRQAGAAAGLCGLWVGLADGDHIFYETATSAFHQRHIILHELSHLLLDHTTDSDGSGVDDRPEVEILFPGLDPAMVRRLLARGRTDYTELQEQKAELMATLIHRRASDRASRSIPGSAHGSGLLEQLARALGPSRPR
ncbi:ImmA/IrrE family metallo-endopeptidase [Streptomyces tritici]|uniref:ImmA/IrrE family metallo-endopeptidase n=1 Tax=Streptomyces tritici TaxID=2054410 RepID=UPI003AF13F68